MVTKAILFISVQSLLWQLRAETLWTTTRSLLTRRLEMMIQQDVYRTLVKDPINKSYLEMSAKKNTAQELRTAGNEAGAKKVHIAIILHLGFEMAQAHKKLAEGLNKEKNQTGYIKELKIAKDCFSLAYTLGKEQAKDVFNYTEAGKKANEITAKLMELGAIKMDLSQLKELPKRDITCIIL